jgi:hypothetical protein
LVLVEMEEVEVEAEEEVFHGVQQFRLSPEQDIL